MQKKGLLQRLLWLAMALVLLIGSVSPQTAAAGSVRVEAYDFDGLYQRLHQRFPEIFAYSPLKTPEGQEVGDTEDIRMILEGFTYYVNGQPAGNYSGSFGWQSFNGGGERFLANDDIAYCFDWHTAAGTGANHQPSSLAEINPFSPEGTMNVARAARMLTENNFALITEQAEWIAEAFTSDAGKTIAKEEVVRLLQSTDADAASFKRMLVQMMVWKYMNQMTLGKQKAAFQVVEGYFDKEGHWHEPEPLIVPPTIGLEAFIPAGKLYSLGLEEYYAHEDEMRDTWKARYALEVDVPFTVPQEDVEKIRLIAQNNGNKVESSGSVTVYDDGTDITLTATQPLSWTGWTSFTDTSDSIYSSVPYIHGATQAEGGGQFIVRVGNIRLLKVRVKAEIKKVQYDPIGILLQKKDGKSQDDVRPVEL